MQTAFQIKGSLFTLSVLQILQPSLDELEKQITIKVKQAPQFFNNTSMVVDLTSIEKNIDIDFISQLSQLLKKHTLLPIGFRCKEKSLIKAIQDQAFPIFKKERQVTTPQITDAKSLPRHNKILDTRIRSGQQVIAQSGDLIVLSSVSAGAELLATGNIHVYGTLRGRAIAGLEGDTNARIFCQKLEADLISIAGQYKIFENEISPSEDFKHGYQIQLKNGTIAISPL